MRFFWIDRFHLDSVFMVLNSLISLYLIFFIKIWLQALLIRQSQTSVCEWFCTFYLDMRKFLPSLYILTRNDKGFSMMLTEAKYKNATKDPAKIKLAKRKWWSQKEVLKKVTILANNVTGSRMTLKSLP